MARRRIAHYNAAYGPVENDGTPQAMKNEFARRLEAARVAKGWNQSELARRASEVLPKPARGQKQGRKVGRDQISHYSRGVSMPRPEVLNALAKALGLEPADLLPPNVPSTATPPALRITQIDDANVQLTINRAVPLTLAMEIVAILAKEDKK